VTSEIPVRVVLIDEGVGTREAAEGLGFTELAVRGIVAAGDGCMGIGGGEHLALGIEKLWEAEILSFLLAALREHNF
jgi:hypothetical protein